MEQTVLLSYPPSSSVWHLPMGIAYLAGVLRARGHEVEQIYGYIDGVEYVLRARAGTAAEHALRVIRDPKSSILARYDARMTFERATLDSSDFENFSVERNNVRYDSKVFKGDIGELRSVIRNRERHVFYDYFVNVEMPRAVAARPAVFAPLYAVHAREACSSVITGR